MSWILTIFDASTMREREKKLTLCSMISDFFYPQPGGVESHIYQLSSVRSTPQARHALLDHLRYRLLHRLANIDSMNRSWSTAATMSSSSPTPTVLHPTLRAQASGILQIDSRCTISHTGLSTAALHFQLSSALSRFCDRSLSASGSRSCMAMLA